MYISILEMFKIGIGPSSSHTLGPMKAAKLFLDKALAKGVNLSKIKQVKTDLYGSLALTGKGHHTDKAVIMGLLGEDPETVDTESIYNVVDAILLEKKLRLLKADKVELRINFLRSQKLPYHTNGLKFTLINNQDQEVHSEIYYSIGGGFILSEEETLKEKSSSNKKFGQLPYQYKNAKEMFYICETNDISLPKLIMENEKVYHNTTEKFILERLEKIWNVMDNCTKRGLSTSGILPGPMQLKRRAPDLYKNVLNHEKEGDISDPMYFLNWVNVHAIAVSEENANGGQVVTSPTNGSAGVIPAVINYYLKFGSKKHPDKLLEFLICAGAIGGIFKLNSTISGAEGGCQAEIGVSSSMAAAGLTHALGGKIDQVEWAAESAMEHFIGMTCDPIGGMVQIPCIERNGVGAVKAINASSIALTDTTQRKINLDRIVRVMKKTGDDMKAKYKETSKGGLAKEYYRKHKQYRYQDNDGEETIRLLLPNTLC